MPPMRPAINLNVTETAEIDEVLGHMKIVRAFTTCEPDVFTTARERRVGTESPGMERLFQPNGANLTNGLRSCFDKVILKS